MSAIFTIEREQNVPQPLEEVFAFFSDAANLQALTPDWLRFQILTPQPIVLAKGALIDYRLKWHGIPLRWRTLIAAWEPPHRFVDMQLKGPYKLWEHTHSFMAVTGGTRITDSVKYSLPFGWMGGIAHALSVRQNVEGIFDYREERIRALFGDSA